MNSSFGVGDTKYTIIMCEEPALMRFVEHYESNAMLQKLQNRIAARIKEASEDEIIGIVIDEMFKYHEETASYYGRMIPGNLYPTEEERGYFADVALYNLIPYGRISDNISSSDLTNKRLKMRERLKELQKKKESNR